MNFLTFIVLLPCTLLISTLLSIPIINIVEYIDYRFLNKKIEILDSHYVAIILCLWIILMYVFYSYFTGLDVDYYSNINY